MNEEASPERSPIHSGQPAKLRELGYDEIWLQNWLAAEPTRLGVGEVTIVAQELAGPRGGSLDILAASADGDTHYSIEVQLGEVDASHSFRVFEYWAANRARTPGKSHVAVLMAESTAGRFRQALDALAEKLPLIVIELRVWRGHGEAIVVPETVIANESLDVAGIAGPVGGRARTEADWREQATDEAWRFVQEFIEWTRSELGDIRVDYAPQSYIGVRRGRRVWAPLWLRADGATTYLPDPDGSKEEPSVGFEQFIEQLRGVGRDASWAPAYNAGSNPVSLRLKAGDLEKDPVQALLRASFEILEPNARAWSERNPAVPMGRAEPSAVESRTPAVPSGLDASSSTARVPRTQQS